MRTKLRALAAGAGLICVILASNDSMVYEFKRSAYGLLGVPDHFMMTAEIFHELLDLREYEREQYVADTYMDVSDFFAGDTKAERLSRWLSYLLRIKFENLPYNLRDNLLLMVRDRALRVASLPEILKSEYRLCHSPSRDPE